MVDSNRSARQRRLTRRQRLFLRLAALFLFVLYALVLPLRDWVPLWLPVLALLGLESLIFWTGYRDCDGSRFGTDEAVAGVRGC